MVNKIFNWTVGSFFRTLGRLLVYFFLGYVLFSFIDIKGLDLFLGNVYADETDVVLNNVKLQYNNFTVVNPGTRIININANTVYGQYGNGETPPDYYIGTFCTDSDNIVSWQGTTMSGQGTAGTTYPNTLVQLNFYNTNYRCMFPNSTYTGGHIVYVYGEILPLYSTSGTSATLMGRISYTQPNQASWSLLSWSWSNEPVTIDYSSSSIISQNQDIINQNQSIINQNDTMINQNSTIISQNNNIWDKSNEINNNITNDNVDESANSLQSWFSNFNTNTHGLTGIITSPLNAINSLTSKTCQPLNLPLPFVNKNLSLPCMRNIYEHFFGNFMILYDTITLGIVSYWVLVRIFSLVKDFKNPDHDEVEVLDL